MLHGGGTPDIKSANSFGDVNYVRVDNLPQKQNERLITCVLFFSAGEHNFGFQSINKAQREQESSSVLKDGKVISTARNIKACTLDLVKDTIFENLMAKADGLQGAGTWLLYIAVKTIGIIKLFCSSGKAFH